MDKIKAGFKKVANAWRDRQEKATEDAKKHFAEKKANPQKRREKKRTLHKYMMSLKGTSGEVLDYADLVRNGMTRADIRHMLKRYFAYGVRVFFKNRPGNIVQDRKGVIALVTGRGKFLVIGRA